MSEQLGIIKEVGIGNRDVGSPVLFFSIYISEGIAALQIISWKDAYNVLKESGVNDIKDLEGRPCWVEVKDKENTIKFLRIAKI